MNNAGGSRRRNTHFHHFSLFALSLLPLIAVASHALAAPAPVLPSGGVVVGGQARIGAPGGSSLTVSQGSAKAIIDWGSFSIGQGGTVRFDNGSGATLNRVTGQELSSIDGLLSASGSVYLLNPNGVVIGKGGVVKVGGSFVASTLDVSNGAFLTGGDLSFIGSSTAKVINLGKVGALGGDVVLMASAVRNEGAVTAAKGDVGLVAGARVLLRDQALDGGRFTVLVGGAGTRVTNSGSISAAMVELRANGGDVYALAGDTSGVIRATGVSAREGRVFLTAGDSGSVTLGGTVAARGPNGAGGAIETSAGKVSIGSARIDAGPRGSWLLDPNDLTIDQTAANTIATTLNGGTSVTQQTTAAGTGGSGDINVAANVSLNWTTNAGLTLSAYRNVSLGAASTLGSSGGGAVTLYADNTGTGVGTVGFGSGAKVSTSAAVNIFYDPASNPAGSAINGASYASGTDYSALVTGGGSLTAYMLVNTLNDLQDVQNNLSGMYGLGRDIDAGPTSSWNGGAGFAPIGPTRSSQFSGILDGHGYTISNLTISIREGNAAGLFGYVAASGILKDLTLTGVNIGGGSEVGGLVGSNAGSVSSVSVSGSIVGAVGGNGGSGIGGLIGFNSGSVQNASSNVAVSSAPQQPGSVQSYTSQVGGMVGDNAQSGSLDRVSASGSVSGGDTVGGLAGENDGKVTGATSSATVAATLSSGGEAGGLIGTNSSTGFQGNGFQGVVTNAYAIGSVTATGTAGGLIGFSGNSALSNAYASGHVVGPTSGGLIGATFQGSIVNSYWDLGTTGQTVAVGPNTTAGSAAQTNVVGLGGSTGISAYAQSTYAGFDFGAAGTWMIFDGATRPMLRSEAATRITNAHQLQLIDLDRAGAYTLAADIDLSVTSNPSDVWNPVVGFVPIASRPGAADPFVGSLDGQGHTISNLTIASTYDNIGLFGNIGAAGSVRDLTLRDVSVTGGDTVGALAGLSLGAITGVNVSGAVSGKASVGGLVGSSFGALSSDTSAAAVAGGVGCDGCQFAGGLVGYANGPISDSSAIGQVTGYQYIGGLAGRVVDVSDSYATGGATGRYHDVGGLVGQAFGLLYNDHATGGAAGTENVGGLVGYLNGSGVISSSYASGGSGSELILTAANVGGLVGTSDGTIVNAYVADSGIGGAGGYFGVGGLVGLANGGVIRNVYVSANQSCVLNCPITGPQGGLVGYTGAVGPTITNAYWDVRISGQSTALGAGYNAVQTNVAAIGIVSPYSAAYAQATYAGFDFSAAGPWVIFEGSTRPMLRSEASTVIANAHQLQLMDLNRAGDYTLANDIVLSETYSSSGVWNRQTGFVPIASRPGAADPFTGSLDGQGHTIDGGNITSIYNAVGLFGVVGPSGRIGNLTYYGYATGGYYTGALVGDNFGTVSNIEFNGGATGAGGVGGLIGVSERGSTVTSISAPALSNSTIAVTAIGFGDDVGGLIGVNLGTATNLSATAQVRGQGNVGGLIGLNIGTLVGSNAAAVVQGTYGAGGLVGANYGLIVRSSATGAVAFNGPAGGVTISGGQTGSSGGLVGVNAAGASISDSYATGPSSGGALIGLNDGSVSRAYATGAVGASGAGISTVNNGSLLDTFWDPTTTGTTTGVASGPGSNVGVLPIGAGTGLDPLQASGYPGFDFTNVWTIVPGVSRPTLQVPSGNAGSAP